MTFQFRYESLLVPPNVPSIIPSSSQMTTAKPSRGTVVAIIFGTIGGLALLALFVIWCFRLSRINIFATLGASLKLADTRMFPMRSVPVESPVKPPSFHPSLLVRTPSPSPTLMPPPVTRTYVPPSQNNHVSLPNWLEGPLVPLRRQETDSDSRGQRSASMPLQPQLRSPPFGLGNSHQPPSPPANTFELDLASLFAPSDGLPPPAPPPVRVSRPPRRFTVRNK
jgi:hypothetical protein